MGGKTFFLPGTIPGPSETYSFGYVLLMSGCFDRVVGISSMEDSVKSHYMAVWFVVSREYVLNVDVDGEE